MAFSTWALSPEGNPPTREVLPMAEMVAASRLVGGQDEAPRLEVLKPKEVFGKDYAFLPKDQVLSFEEIERLAAIFVGLGVEKLRITGGEPLIRRDLPYYDPTISEETVSHLNRFAQDVGLLTAPVGYDQVVATPFRHLWSE